MEPKQQPPYPLRINPELRERLEVEAQTAKRSLNAEIADRLERSINGESAPDATVKSFAAALARAQQDAAMAAVQSEGRLFAAANVSNVLVEVLDEIARREITLNVNQESLDEAYINATKFVRDAEHRFESGGLDAVIERAEVAQRRLDEAQAALMELATRRSRSSDLPAERVVSFKGPSGKARKIEVTTKARRGAPKP